MHFVIDTQHAERIAAHWGALGSPSVTLELIECPDRRLARAATELAAELAADGETEVTLVLPRRIYHGVANRLLHSHTADRIVTAVSTIPNVSATIAPFDVGGLLKERARLKERGRVKERTRLKERPRRGTAHATVGDATATAPAEPRPGRKKGGETRRFTTVEGATPIGDLVYRQRMRFAGRVRSVRVQPWSGVPALECTLVDTSGAVNIVFLGRRSVPGIETGTQLVAEGMVGRHGGRLAVINPSYELLEAGRLDQPGVSSAS